ncbi:PAAR domain-containing protein [Burkholderia sp. LMG 32019]|uniref:PAAR domain-containing protein n=1 Tax=Burkholderia sp. LMG 32019 TaxID=3158173 RepID=UPI003C2EFBC3
MMQQLVAKGDITTTGGRVVSGTSAHYDERGNTMARDGDQATCGKCKGVFSIHGSARDWLDGGKPMVKDWDLVLCPCRNNRVRASMSSTFYISDGGGGKKSNAAASTDSFAAASNQSYDEQVRIIDEAGVPIRHIPYFIKDAAGRVYKGMTDDEGLCPRVYTDGKQALNITVGMKALEHWNA